MQHATLRHDHHPEKREAISFAAGERLVLGPRDADWPDFLEATDPRGRRGRVPKDRLDGDKAVRDYDGRELEGNAGDAVRLMELYGGWWWAENAIGETGWLPEHALSIDPGIK